MPTQGNFEVISGKRYYKETGKSQSEVKAPKNFWGIECPCLLIPKLPWYERRVPELAALVRT